MQDKSLPFIPRPGMWVEIADVVLIGRAESIAIGDVIATSNYGESSIIVYGADGNKNRRIVMRFEDKRCASITSDYTSRNPALITFGFGPQVLHTYEVDK